MDPLQARALDRLNSVIAERGLTETEVASMAGFTQGHMWKVLNGKSTETAFWVIARIANALNVSLDWIIQTAPPPRPTSAPPPATGTDSRR